MVPIRQINPKLSKGLEDIILKCTEKDPAKRYQSTSELTYALEHYQDQDEGLHKQYKKEVRSIYPNSSTCSCERLLRQVLLNS